MKKHLSITLLSATLLLCACGTKKEVVDAKTGASTSATVQPNTGTDDAVRLKVVRTTADQAVYQRNIVAKIDFTVNSGKKDITLDGQLRMRRDEVIRLQISPLGLVEVARIEFTPDYVLLLDRVHKTYVRGSYDDIGFLRQNGLNFYTLQALFWNQLFMPGKDVIGEADYGMYDVELTPLRRIRLAKERMDLVWAVGDKGSGEGRISQAAVAYDDGRDGKSRLEWNYGDFRQMGSKWFPYDHQLSLTTEATNKKRAVQVRMRINKVTADDGWETQTTVSGKYKKVSADEVLEQITGKE